jgi:DNA polymerase-3 subunit epsilon
MYFDVETTGLSAAKCAIHQLSYIIEIDGELKERGNIQIKPFEGALVNEKALKVSGVDIETINSYPNSYKRAFFTFEQVLDRYVNKFNKSDKMFLVGYNNASFDNHFLRAFHLRNDHKYFGSYFWANPIDVYILASAAIMEERHTLEDFKLKTACKHFGITVDESKLHDAIYDVELTRKLFNTVK